MVVTQNLKYRHVEIKLTAAEEPFIRKVLYSALENLSVLNVVLAPSYEISFYVRETVANELLAQLKEAAEEAYKEKEK